MDKNRDDIWSQFANRKEDEELDQAVWQAKIDAADATFIKNVVPIVNNDAQARHPEVLYVLLKHIARGKVSAEYMAPHVQGDTRLLISRELWMPGTENEGNIILGSTPADGWGTAKLERLLRPLLGVEAPGFVGMTYIVIPGVMPEVAKVRRAA